MGAHGPATAIGRAVEAFATVSVAYEPGSAVSDVEAGNFPTIVGSNLKVAFMPASAAMELGGGPSAIAEDVATRPGSAGPSSSSSARTSGPGATTSANGAWPSSSTKRSGKARPPPSEVDALVRSLQDEPTDRTPWPLIGLVLAVVASGALVAYDRLARGRGDPAG